MQWWNNLPDLSIKTEKNKSAFTKKHLGDERIHKSLTGREIEEIYEAEVNKLVCAECGSDDVESKAWFNWKTGSIGTVSNDEEDNWCNGCDNHVKLI